MALYTHTFGFTRDLDAAEYADAQLLVIEEAIRNLKKLKKDDALTEEFHDSIVCLSDELKSTVPEKEVISGSDSGNVVSFSQPSTGERSEEPLSPSEPRCF